MSDLKTATEELLGVLDHLNLDVSEAVSDDVSTIGILAGKLSPGQLAEDEIQWVLAHLFGDIMDALDDQDAKDLAEIDEPLVAFTKEVKKSVGEISNEDLNDEVESILSDADEGEAEPEAEAETEEEDEEE